MPPKRHHEDDEGEEIDTSNKRQRVIPNSNTRSQQIYDVIDSAIGIWTSSQVLPPLIDIIRSYTVPPTRWVFLVTDDYDQLGIQFYDPQTNQMSNEKNFEYISSLSFLKFSNVTGQLYYILPIGNYWCYIYTIDADCNRELICNQFLFRSGCQHIWTPSAVVCENKCFDLVSKTCLPFNEPIHDVTSSIPMGDRSFIAFSWHYKDGARCFYYNGSVVQEIPKPCSHAVHISLIVDNKLITGDRHQFKLVLRSLSFTKQTNGDLVFDDQWNDFMEISYEHAGSNTWVQNVDIHRLDQHQLLFHSHNSNKEYRILDIQSDRAMWRDEAVPTGVSKPIDIIACEVETNAVFASNNSK